MPVHDILFHEKGLDFHNNVLYSHDNVIDFLNNALYRILSETGQISGYFLLFFALKNVSFANSVTQKKRLFFDSSYFICNFAHYMYIAYSALDKN